MSHQSDRDTEMPDGEAFVERLGELAERSQRLFMTFAERQKEAGSEFYLPDPGVVAKAFAQFGAALLAQPQTMVDAQLRYWEAMGELWRAHLRRMMGEEVPPLVQPAPGDRRFKDEAWNEDLIFDYIKQSYLLTARWIQETVANVEGLDKKTRDKVEFYTRQYVDAIAPSNFAATNPTVLKTAAETRGESLYVGFKRLLEDLERGKGELKISMTNEEAFKVGENIATTPGKVVFQNDLMQLIQYSPTTEKVDKRPLLLVPPWINKYYILDLKPKNSFIKWAVDQGLTLFVISWVNPDEKLAGKSFEDYLEEGPLAAMDAIEAQTGERELNILGYCIGGTLTACLLAVLKARGDDRVKSATFFTTMLDFSEPGELAVFIDEDQLTMLEDHMAKKGYLEARHMQRVFSLMRANDLIWSFVVNNYLLGREPLAFDLLYWNSDSTRMPSMMHRFYLRNMYQENRLAQPGGIELLGVPIDLAQVKVPTYFLAAKEDHIAPWKAAYTSSRLVGGSARFVLGGSGHIAGVINPAGSAKYGYWLNPKKPADPEAWLAGAEHREGSWWPDWAGWVHRRGGGRVAARRPEEGRLAVIEDAPGHYVKIRAPD